MGRDDVQGVALVIVCQIVHWLTFAAIPLFLPLIREDLGITFTQAGLLSVAGTLSYALGQIPAGYLADRFGPGRLFAVGLAGWSILSAVFGLVHVFWLALVTQLFAGAFRALLFTPGLVLLATWFPAERRAMAMSLFMLGGSAGTIVVALGGPALTAYYGWRPVFVSCAVLGIVAAVLFRLFARERSQPASVKRPETFEVARLFRYPVIWVCGALQFVRFSVVTAFAFWLPSFLVADRGFTVQTAGLVIAMSAACGAASGTVGGYVSDRLRNPPLVIGSSLAVLACASVLLVTVESVPLLIAVIAVYAVFQQFYFGSLFLVPMEILGQRVAGTATGVSNLFANVGGLSTAYALGVVRDRAEAFTWGFVGIGAACLAGVVFAVLLARIRARALSPH
jgi:sugar phosphate permease